MYLVLYFKKEQSAEMDKDKSQKCERINAKWEILVIK